MKKIFLILMILLLNVSGVFARTLPDCDIKIISSEIDGSKITCKAKISCAKGWHPAQKPTIKIIKSENFENFKYDDSGECKGIGGDNYLIEFSFSKNDGKFSADLNMIFPLCSEICTYVTKNLKISDETLGKIKKTSETKKESVSIFSKYFLMMMFFAFLGGLILNVMPCVLPVLLLKLKTFTYSGESRKAALCGSILGNYFVFFIFACVTYLLRASGELVGWGMHFQNVVFLKIIAVILFLLFLYSRDLIIFSPSFEIKNESKSVIVGNFISSLIASIVALPCTAPFLGTAAAFSDKRIKFGWQLQSLCRKAVVQNVLIQKFSALRILAYKFYAIINNLFTVTQEI